MNGERQGVSCIPGTWAVVERKWSSGDRVSIELPMEVRSTCVDQQHPQRVAFIYGPTVLVRRNRTLSSDSLSKFARQKDSNTFRLSLSGEQEFVPFYSVGFHEPYEMYFDLS